MNRPPAALLAWLLACGPAMSAPVEKPIALPPLTDLVPAAGLDMLVDVRPRELLAHELGPLLTLAIPAAELETFARRHGGVDPRQLEEMVVATYGPSTLALGEGQLSTAAIEQAFRERTTRQLLRAVDVRGGPLSSIVRLEGTDATEPEGVVMFGRRAVAVETTDAHGSLGLLRATELFATGRLTRAKPALRAAPLDNAAAVTDRAPVRVFVPGPFEGASKKGLAGLLAGATAVAIAVYPAPDSPQPALDVTVSLLGAWNDDAANAGQRFAAAVENMTRTDLGRLCGLHEPIRGPDLRISPAILTVSARVDARKLAAGARAATGGQLSEIMAE